VKPGRPRCRRRRDPRSRPPLSSLELSQVGSRQLDEFRSAPGQDGPGRVQGEALELTARLRADLATVVREQQRGDELPGGVSAEAVATVMLSVVPGCMLQLALTGPEAVSEAPRAVRALWP